MDYKLLSVKKHILFKLNHETKSEVINFWFVKTKPVSILRYKKGGWIEFFSKICIVFKYVNKVNKSFIGTIEHKLSFKFFNVFIRFAII